MFKAEFIAHGFYSIGIGHYDTKELAAKAIVEHILENFGIPRPRVVATMKIRSKEIRIDYGSKTCYYLITLTKKMEETNDEM